MNYWTNKNRYFYIDKCLLHFMFIRVKKNKKGRRYYCIVESFQTEDGENRQKVVKYLGTVEKILSVFEEFEGRD